MTKIDYDFDRRPDKCPSHNLSVGDDALCLICHLELSGEPTPTYETIPEGHTGMVPGEPLPWGNRRWSDVLAKDKEKAKAKATKTKSTKKKLKKSSPKAREAPQKP